MQAVLGLPGGVDLPVVCFVTDDHALQPPASYLHHFIQRSEHVILIAHGQPDGDIGPVPADASQVSSYISDIATIDPDELNNVYTATTTIRRWYDLNVTKDLAPGQVTRP